MRAFASVDQSKLLKSILPFASGRGELVLLLSLSLNPLSGSPQDSLTRESRRSARHPSHGLHVRAKTSVRVVSEK